MGMAGSARVDRNPDELVIHDAVGEWWIHPLATYLAEPPPRTVLSALSRTGRVLVCEIDYLTGSARRHEVGSASDHNVPAVWVGPGRRPLVAWTHHNGDLLRVKGRASDTLAVS